MKQVLIVWRLVIFKASNGYFLAVAAAFLGFTDGPEWHTPVMRYVRLVLFCLIAGHKFLDGFFDQTAQRIRSGRFPLPLLGDDTGFIPKPPPTVPPGAG